jgi:hypothetical protein
MVKLNTRENKKVAGFLMITCETHIVPTRINKEYVAKSGIIHSRTYFSPIEYFKLLKNESPKTILRDVLFVLVVIIVILIFRSLY